MNDISKRRNTYWRASIILFSCLLFFLLNWLPVTAQVARTSPVLHEVAPSVIQSTPTVDPTVAALNKQKLENDTSWWWNNTVPLITSLVTILSLLGGGIFTVIRVTGEQQANRERQKEEHDQWVQDQNAEREKQGEARFQNVVEGLGSSSKATQVGAAITLRTFLRPDYRQFYRQVFDLAVVHLRLRNLDQKKIEPLDSLSQALITIFKESFPLARQQLEDTKNMQQLDATQVQLDQAYLANAQLQNIWMPQSWLREANLSGADLSGANLYWTNLSFADLSGADFSGADLRIANLSGVNPYRANPIVSRSYRANPVVTRFKRANLSGANLSGADLSEADLSEADLSKADLSGANLSGANLQTVQSWKDAKLLNIKGLTPGQLTELETKGAIIK